MTQDHLDAILKTFQLKADKEGYFVLPEGTTMTIHAAHGGASLTLSRIEAVRADNGLVYARTPKRELFAVARDDVFAVSVDSQPGQPARRPGFG